MIKKTDDDVVDAVLISSAIETEHHEIAVYQTLVGAAHARGVPEVERLLRENLEQEEAALEKVRAHAQRISTEGVSVLS